MVRYNHRIALAVALTFGFAASVAPVAWADPQPLASAEAASAASQNPATPAILPNADEQGVTDASTSTAPCSDVCSGSGYGKPVAASTVAPAVAPTDSFDWDDAGVGAGSVLVLTLLLAGGGLIAIRVRRRTTHGSAQQTT